MRKLENEELNRLTADQFHKTSKTPLVLVLDNVRSLLNVGSIFRTADAFLIESVYLCGITGTPPNKEIEKTALGATSTVNWVHFTDTLAAVEKLKTDGYEVYAIEQAENAIMLDKFGNWGTKKMAVIFGNEVKGVEQQVIDKCKGVIEIPQLGTKHSLNIAVSAGIVVWDLYTKLSH